MKNNNKKLGLGLLMALTISSMIGGGIFNSPTDLISVANPQAALIAWGISGIGVVCLAFVFKLLADKRPQLQGGIYSHAKEGFGDFIGFNSAWGYWISGIFGNIAFFTLMIKTLNSLLGTEYALSPLATFILASVILWGIVYFQTRGVREVGIINAMVTIAKLFPLALVVIFSLFVFDPSIFAVENWKTILASSGDQMTYASLSAQINGALGVILWCFTGMEASSVMTEKAKSAKVVGIATVSSIIVTLVIYIGISMLAMGVLSPVELANSTTPLADVLSQTAVGPFGAVIVKVGLIVSTLGALISWIMLAAQIPNVAAKEGVMPKIFSKETKNGVAIYSLIITNIIVQLGLFVLLTDTLQNMYTIAILLSTTCILIPYFLSSLYALKVCKKDNLKAIHWVYTIVAVIYSMYVIVFVGLIYLAASFILYAIGMFVFLLAKKENNQPLTTFEKYGVATVLTIGIIMIVLLATGVITL